jgi:hypothetical protein
MIGEHIRARKGGIWNHAIDCGDQTVIHLVADQSVPPGDRVRRSYRPAFLAGADRVEVVTHRERVFAPRLVVARAFSRAREPVLAAAFRDGSELANWCKAGRAPEAGNAADVAFTLAPALPEPAPAAARAATVRAKAPAGKAPAPKVGSVKAAVTKAVAKVRVTKAKAAKTLAPRAPAAKGKAPARKVSAARPAKAKSKAMGGARPPAPARKAAAAVPAAKAKVALPRTSRAAAAGAKVKRGATPGRSSAPGPRRGAGAKKRPA